MGIDSETVFRNTVSDSSIVTSEIASFLFSKSSIVYSAGYISLCCQLIFSDHIILEVVKNVLYDIYSILSVDESKISVQIFPLKKGVYPKPLKGALVHS